MKRKYIGFLLAVALLVSQFTFPAIGDTEKPFSVTDSGNNKVMAESAGSGSNKRIHIYPTIDDRPNQETLYLTYTGKTFADNSDLNSTVTSSISSDEKTLEIALENFEANNTEDYDIAVKIDDEDYEIRIYPVTSWDIKVTGGGKGKVSLKDSGDPYSVDTAGKTGSCVAELGSLTLKVEPETGSKIKDISIKYKYQPDEKLVLEELFTISDDTGSARTYTLDSNHGKKSYAYKVEVTFEQQGKESDAFTALDSDKRTLQVEKGEDLKLKKHDDLPDEMTGKDASTYHIYYLQDEEGGTPVEFSAGSSNKFTLSGSYHDDDLKIARNKNDQYKMKLTPSADYQSNTDTAGKKYLADFFFVVDEEFYYNGILYPSALWNVTLDPGGTVTIHEEGRENGSKNTLTTSGKVITEAHGFDIVFTVKPNANYKVDLENYKFEGIDEDKLEIVETDGDSLVIKIKDADLKSKQYDVHFGFEGGDVDITPHAPTNLKGSVYYGIVILDWTSVTPATGYKVYMRKSGSGEFAEVMTISAANASITGLSPGTYDFVVSAVNGSKESGYSNTVTIEVVGGTIGTLDPPGGLSVISTNTVSATVGWDKVTDATVGYYVYWSDSDYGPYQTSPLLTATTYTVTGLEPGATYYVFVASVGEGGISVKSDALKVTTKTGAEGNTSLETPANLRITGTTATSISLTWDEVDEATGYNVYFSKTYSGDYEVGDVSGNGCTIYDLESGTKYYIYVTATNAEGEGKSSVILAAATARDGAGGTGGYGRYGGGYVVTTTKSTAQIESMSGHQFRVGLPLLSFMDAYVDGKRLQRGTNYSVSDGSTVLTLKDDFIDTLDGGRHTLRMDFTSSTATAEFTKGTTASGAPTVEPISGDWGSNVTLNPKTGR